MVIGINATDFGYGESAYRELYRVLLFLDHTPEEMKDFYRDFLLNKYVGVSRKSYLEMEEGEQRWEIIGRFSEKKMSSYHTDLSVQGFLEAGESSGSDPFYQAAMRFESEPVLSDNYEEELKLRDEHMEEFAGYLLGKSIPVAERLPFRVPQESRDEISRMRAQLEDF